jgi:hypothetical protein
MVRTCQNSLGQDGTRLGLLLLLVGPNDDGFGGQAFMEHYSVERVPVAYHRNLLSTTHAKTIIPMMADPTRLIHAYP